MTGDNAVMFLRIVLIIALLAAIATFAHAARGATCVYKSEDVGTIIGVGPNKDLAFSDAALQCFDRHDKLYRRVKNADHLDEESAIVMIDLCANLKCQP